METLRGFRLFRQDPEWLSKMLVMTVLLFIPTVGQIVVIGWGALFLRGIVRGRPEGWTPPLRFDFDYLVKLADPGFKGWLVQIAWSFPIIFIVMITFGCGGALTSILAAGAAGAADHSGGGAGAAGLVTCFIPVLYLIMIPIILAAQIPAMFAAMRAELTNELKDGFQFGEVMKMTKLMFREAMMGLLILTAVSFPLVILGELALCVGLFVVIWVLFIVRTHWQAQLYQLYLQKGGTPLNIASDEIVMPAPMAAPTPPPAPM